MIPNGCWFLLVPGHYFPGRGERRAWRGAPAAVVEQKALPERGRLRPAAPIAPYPGQSKTQSRCFALAYSLRKIKKLLDNSPDLSSDIKL